MNELAELSRQIAELEKSETERQRGEGERVKGEMNVQRILDNILEGCMIIGFDWSYLYVNSVAARHGHQNREKLIGRSMFEMYPGVEKSFIFAAYHRCMEERVQQRLESEYTFPDGATNWFELSVEPVPEGIFVLSLDITERKQNEEALKESEGRYRTIIEYSNDMIWTLDTEGLFLFFNKRSEEITGFKLEDWRGKSFTPLIEKEELPEIIEVFQKTLNGEPQQYEVTVKKVDGNKIFLLVNTAPIYSKGKVIGTVSCGRDITEHKKAEEQIKETLRQKLKKSNKQRKLLCYLIEGTRGGKTRALILRHLAEKSNNANQIAKALNKDYKTIRHHLEVLVKNGIITISNDGYSDIYFISKIIESDLNEMDMKL